MLWYCISEVNIKSRNDGIIGGILKANMRVRKGRLQGEISKFILKAVDYCLESF
ncbi:hypothetical protein FC82_GL001707 [Secundilactobacillus collinoides DSM 20515 = JCM 1123]|uniref:Uncharacterized protein n=1 Tax=Secundilactobacillus collinoides DSM 20515 = JCM 1123 TaxID=1423733 RepID=A0A0R2BJR6_SECCO|nr:hypothetical protein FC82_GL001707 [Secundilactobacillus collinoides DSM 20515 = JCM 1123]